MAGFLSGISDFANNLLGRGSSQEQDHQSTDRLKENGSKKRVNSGESSEVPSRKRKDTRSELEKRLIPTYGGEKGTTRITVPKALNSDGSEDSRRRVARMAVKPGTGRGGFKPTNTLNSERYAATRPNQINRSSQPYTVGHELRRSSSLQTQLQVDQRPMNGRSKSSLVGDGFEQHERSLEGRNNHGSNKKRKLDVETSRNSKSNEHIDLTEDDENEVVHMEVTALNGNPVSGSKPQTQSSIHSNDKSMSSWKVPEVENLHALTSVARPKPKRKSRDGAGSSQASSRGTPTAANSFGNGARPQTQSVSEAIVVQSQEEPSQDPPAPKGPAQQRLPIDLGEGVDRPSKVAKPRKSMGQNHELGQIDTLLQQDNSPRLSDTFKRDEPGQTKMRASQRMKRTSEKQPITSRVSPINDFQGSEDELAGKKTVASSHSLRTSPQKTGASVREKSSSPADIQPSQFTQGTIGRRSNTSNAQVSGRNENSKENPIKAPLKAFYATGCILKSGQLELEYDESEGVFYLYHNGMPRALPGRQTMVSLTETEISKVMHCPDNERVYIKGSMGNLSNGNVCIAFKEYDGVLWFLRQIHGVAKDPSLKFLSNDVMNKTFEKQVHDIEVKRRQEDTQRANESEIEALAENKRKLPSSLQRADEEEIKYEQPNETRGSLRRTTGLRKETERFKASPYFEELQGTERRRSSRQPKPVKRLSLSPPPPIKWSRENKLQPWNHSVVYPPTGVRRVTVDFQDIERLDEGEFLNDNLVSFALRRIEENMSPVENEKVYFFNSFFYSSLTKKAGKRAFNYDAVKRWTKGNDLFSFPYVVVPICINLHWFVMIICNLPSVSRKAAGMENDDEEDDQENDARNADALETSLKAADEPGAANFHLDAEPSSRTLTDGLDGPEVLAQTEAMSQLSLSQEASNPDLERQDGGDDGIDLSKFGGLPVPKSKLGGSQKSKKKGPPPPKKYDPDEPTIITLDSFGTGHATETRMLKDYLKAEAEAKRGMTVDTKELQGMTAKGIPEQTNFCDCGLYLVGYVEEFAKNPRQFITKVLTRQLDRQADFASFDPSAKRAEIRDELIKLHELQNAERKAKKSAKKSTTKGLSDTAASSPTPAPPKSPSKEEPAVPKLADAAKTTQVPADKKSQATEQAAARDSSKQTSDAVEDDEMELAVPRAVQEASVRSHGYNADPKFSRTGAGLSPAKDPAPPSPTDTHQDGANAGPHGQQQGIDATLANELDDEEMMYTNQEVLDRSKPVRKDPKPAEPDLLDDFEIMVNNDRKRLESESFSNKAKDAVAPKASSGRQSRSRRTQATPSSPDVIDLESDNDDDREIPDSQEKHVKQPSTFEFPWPGN